MKTLNKTKITILNLILTLNCLFGGSGITWAANIDSTTARIVAQNHYIKNSLTAISSINLAYTEKTTLGDTSLIYFFNINVNDGFVLVSADDAVVPILGYNTVGHFDYINLSPEFHNLIRDYYSQILMVKRDNSPPNQNTQIEWNELLSVPQSGQSVLSFQTVSPLISTTWNQGTPYNDECPGPIYDNAMVGCVAIAQAQIMKYWNFPSVGIGSHSYSSANYGFLSANFGATNYNLANMPNSLCYFCPNADLSTFLLHVGVSVEMNYGSNASGAWVLSNDYQGNHQYCSQNSYVNYFGYAATIQGIERSSYPDASWLNILKNEIDNGRPVQYVGYETNSGHSWICDGYDNNNYLHMNWGWGGSSDGYFNINSLTPGTFNFAYHHGALIGIQPNNVVNIPAPINDNCTNAISIQSFSTCQTIFGTVDGATDDGFPTPVSCNTGATTYGVFYSFVAQSTSETVTITPTTASNIGVDAVVQVLGGANCWSLFEIACGDATDEGAIESLNLSSLTVGSIYYVRVFDYGSIQPLAGNGGFNICVTHSNTPPNNFTVTTMANPANGGYVTGGGTYQNGTTALITAVSNGGYTFINFMDNMGNILSTTNPYNYSVTQNITVIASFTSSPPPTYNTLSLFYTPAPNICTLTGGGQFASGTFVTCTTSPTNPSYVFNNWTNQQTGAILGTSPILNFIINSDLNIIANYNLVNSNNSLTLSSNPPNSSIVTGSGTYISNQNVNISAVANSGFSFLYWKNDNTNQIVSYSPNYTVNMSNNINLTAYCNILASNYNVSTTVSQINFGGTIWGGGIYAGGSNATITAVPVPGYYLVNITDTAGNILSTTSPWSFNVSSDITIVANFAPSLPQTTFRASFTPSTFSPIVGDPINLIDNSTYPGTTIVASSYQGLPFGNYYFPMPYSQNSFPNTGIVFQVAGQYSLTYQIVGANGAMDDTTISFNVQAQNNNQLSASFYADNTTPFAGEQIQFHDISSGNPNSWLWIFNGGNPSYSTLQNPIVVYNNPGSYDVSLTIWNANPIGQGFNFTNYINVLNLLTEIERLDADKNEIISIGNNQYSISNAIYLSELSIDVYDVCGKMVLHNENSETIDLTELTPAIYIIEAKNESKLFHRKVIKN